MQEVSLSREREIKTLHCCTPNVFAYSGIAFKLVINGFANPFGNLKRHTKKHLQKIKKMAIFFFKQQKRTQPAKVKPSDFSAPLSSDTQYAAAYRHTKKGLPPQMTHKTYI